MRFESENLLIEVRIDTQLAKMYSDFNFAFVNDQFWPIQSPARTPDGV